MENGAYNPFISPLSRRDLKEAKRAQGAFGAVGSFDLKGNFEPNTVRPDLLQLLIPISRERVDALWGYLGFRKEGKSAYHDVVAAERLFLYVSYYKVKRGWFSSRWIGDVRIHFGTLMKSEAVYIGTIAGNTQNDMWEHLRSVLAEMDRPFDGTMNAIAGGKASRSHST